MQTHVVFHFLKLSGRGRSIFKNSFTHTLTHHKIRPVAEEFKINIAFNFQPLVPVEEFRNCFAIVMYLRIVSILGKISSSQYISTVVSKDRRRM